MGSQEIIFSLSFFFLLVPNIEKHKKKLSSDEVFHRNYLLYILKDEDLHNYRIHTIITCVPL